MWGVLKNVAVASLSKVDEIAAQGIASATTLLEKLDGEVNDEGNDDEIDEEIDYKKAEKITPSRKEITPNVNQKELVEEEDEWAFGDEETDRSSTTTNLNSAANNAVEGQDSSKLSLTLPKSLQSVGRAYVDTKFETTCGDMVTSSQTPEKVSGVSSKIEFPEENLKKITEDKSNQESESTNYLQAQLSQALQELQSLKQLYETQGVKHAEVTNVVKKSQQEHSAVLASYQEQISSKVENNSTFNAMPQEHESFENKYRLELKDLAELQRKLQIEQEATKQLLEEKAIWERNLQQQSPMLEHLQTTINELLEEKAAREAQLTECLQEMSQVKAEYESIHQMNVQLKLQGIADKESISLLQSDQITDRNLVQSLQSQLNAVFERSKNDKEFILVLQSKLNDKTQNDQNLIQSLESEILALKECSANDKNIIESLRIELTSTQEKTPNIGGREQKLNQKLNKKLKKLELERDDLMQQLSALKLSLQFSKFVSDERTLTPSVEVAIPATDVESVRSRASEILQSEGSNLLDYPTTTDASPPTNAILITNEVPVDQCDATALRQLVQSLQEQYNEVRAELEAKSTQLQQLQSVYQLRSQLKSVQDMHGEFKDDINKQLKEFSEDFMSTATKLTESLLAMKSLSGDISTKPSHLMTTNAISEIELTSSLPWPPVIIAPSETEKQNDLAIYKLTREADDIHDIEKLNIENNLLRREINVLTHSHEKLLEDFKLLNAMIESNDIAFDNQLSITNKELTQKVERLQHQLESIQKDVVITDRDHKQKMESLQGEVDSKTEEIKSLTASHTTLNQLLGEMETRYNIDLMNVRLGNEILQTTIMSLQEKLADHDKLVSLSKSLEEQLQEQKADHEKLVSLNLSMQMDINEQLKRCAELESNLSVAVANEADLMSQNNTLVFQFENLSQQLNSKSAELAILQKSFESIQNQQNDTSELANQLNTSFRENDHLQKKIESLTSQYEVKAVDYENTITQLNLELKSLKSSHDILAAESRKEYESTAAEFSKTLQTLRSELHFLQQMEQQWNSDKSHFEMTIQDRVIENASLREKVKEQSSQITSLKSMVAAAEKQLKELHQSKESLESNHSVQLTAMQQRIVTLEKNNEALLASNESKDVLILELQNQVKSEHSSSSMQLELEKKLTVMTERVTNAELLISKFEEKKKRDLESLRKQNEMMSELQKEKLKSENSFNERLNELTQQISELQTHQSHYIELLEEEKSNKIDLHDEITSLKLQLASKSEHSATVLAPSQQPNVPSTVFIEQTNSTDTPIEADNNSGSVSGSDDMTVSGTSSFVMIDTSGLIVTAKKNQTVKNVDSNSMTLEKLAELQRENTELSKQLQQTHDLLLAASKEHEFESSELRTRYAAAQSLIAELQQERIRLENETKELENTLSRSISSSSAIQRPRAANDMEAGLIDYEYDKDSEEEKKSEAGLLPVVVQLWAIIRFYCPWLLPYIGDRPPRLGLVGQIAVIYLILLHVLLWWETEKRCPVPIDMLRQAEKIIAQQAGERVSTPGNH